MGALTNLINRQMTQYCGRSGDEISAPLSAVLADAGCKVKGMAHSFLVGYHAVEIANLELALPNVKAAIEAGPDQMEHQLDLVRLYEVSDNLIEARIQLEAARKVYKCGLQKARLDSERVMFNSAFKSRANCFDVRATGRVRRAQPGHQTC